jgi:tRNA(Arg) A34 adenosine deaminase TadA
MCLGAVYWANFSNLYFAATKDDAAKAGFSDAQIYKEFLLPKDKRSIPTTQLMRDEAVKVFDKWIISEEKIRY